MAADFHLYWHLWPAEKPRATVVLVHGVAEHCGRYRHLVPVLNAAGFNVYGYDHRGHGRSTGKRGHIMTWSEYRDDLAAFLAFVREQEEAAGRMSAPLFIFGHSMGGLITLDYLEHHPRGISAAAVSGAPIQPAEIANPLLIKTAHFLSKKWPTFSLPLGIKPWQLSRDPFELAALAADRKCSTRVSARWGTEVLATIEKVRADAAKISTPLLVLHGEADRMNSANGARWLHNHISSTDKKLLIYDDAPHEVHNDSRPTRDQFAADVAAWFSAHLPA